jgi:hypothetical protein
VTELLETLSKFVELFDRLHTPYAIMGGWAVRHYGLPRATYDVDFTISIERARLPQLYQAAIEAGFSVAEPYLTGWIDTVSGMPVVKLRLYLRDRGIDVDLFLAESDYQQTLMARRCKDELEGRSVWFVSPEDLILLKLVAGRPRDVGDIHDVLFVQGALDIDYMRNWARQLGVSDRLEELLARSP